MTDAERALAIVVAELRASLANELADSAVRFVVGYSGGIDSTVLLASLLRVADPARVRAVHIDHGLHPESARWAHHCESVGGRLGVGVEAIRVEVARRGNREAQARAARYGAFASRVGANDVLLLAHNADDQTETLLLKLVQGRRAAGMPARRSVGRGRLVRPLLRLPRATIARAAVAIAVPWVDDASNDDLAFDRNFLRHELIPRLAARWPDAVERVARQAEALAAERVLANRALDAELDAIAAEHLPIAHVRASAHRGALLRRWLERRGVGRVADRVLAELDRQLARAERARVVVQHAPRRELRAHAGALHVVDASPSAFAPITWRIDAPLDLGFARLHATWSGARPVQSFCVEVRARRGGERLCVAPGVTRSVKQLLHDACIPPWRRERYPLVYCDGRLAVVPGVAVALDAADRFAVPGAAREARWVVAIEPR